MEEVQGCSTAKEIFALPDINELLMGNRSPLDPWHRLSAISGDCMLLVEFSENEGPRPAFCTPQSPGKHFDPDAFAVWLMSADYQRQSSEDAQLLLRNEEQGVFTFVQHFTLYELQARAFVRPFCLSYICKDRLEPLKQCNKRLFLKELTEALDALNTLESQTITAYYELCYNDTGLASQSQNQSTEKATNNSRFRKLQCEIFTAYKSICGDLKAAGGHSLQSQCTSEHSVNLDAWITTLHRGCNGQPNSLEKAQRCLREASALAPCVYDEFMNACRRILSKYDHWSPSLPYHLMAHFEPSSLVRIGSLPVLYYPTENAIGKHLAEPSSTVNGSSSEAVHRLQQGLDGDEDAHALCVCPRLTTLLYSVLIGKFVLLFGSELRRKSVVAFINALKRFVPSVYSMPPVRLWHEGRLPATTIVDYKLFGLHVPKSSGIGNFVAENMTQYITLVDLNQNFLRAPEYSGSILARLPVVAKCHRSDRTFVPYMLSVLVSYFTFAYVMAAFLADKAHGTKMDKKRRLVQFAHRFGLDNHDFKVIRYVADLVHAQEANDSADLDSWQSAMETVVVDYEVQKVLKF
uniref:UDENN FLCN/SMCR8-type domain-containing protein n=1 Tax=Trichuris muris TaxID=70415 RepID=A0A5S6QMS2_TRIMR